jgi:hypothetical protein
MASTTFKTPFCDSVCCIIKSQMSGFLKLSTITSNNYTMNRNIPRTPSSGFYEKTKNRLYNNIFIILCSLFHNYCYIVFIMDTCLPSQRLTRLRQQDRTGMLMMRSGSGMVSMNGPRHDRGSLFHLLTGPSGEVMRYDMVR